MTTTDKVAAVIRNFPFWDYGMPDVNPNDRYAEWVPDLAKRIADGIAAGTDEGQPEGGNPTTRLLRWLANEPDLIVHGSHSEGRIPIPLTSAVVLLTRAADWLDANHNPEER